MRDLKMEFENLRMWRFENEFMIREHTRRGDAHDKQNLKMRGFEEFEGCQEFENVEI